MVMSVNFMDDSTRSDTEKGIGATPTFYLYGEPHRSVERGFVHVESLDDRSRPSEWTIRSHSHDELAHIFYLGAGGGEMLSDGNRLVCLAPCLLMVPAGTVHGFEWQEETVGFVITLATRKFAELTWLAPEAIDLLAESAVIPLPVDEGERVERSALELMRELSWSNIGHDAAVQAALLTILVSALRQRVLPANGQRKGRWLDLIARLRERVEERFRYRESVSAYAAALGTSETALRVACTAVAGISPAAMLDQRALLEARRALIFSDMSVAEIAYSVGFEDPAYFSRFFAKHMRQPPRSYRAQHRAADRLPGQDFNMA